MKKLFTLVAVLGVLSFGASTFVNAQDEPAEKPDSAMVQEQAAQAATPAAPAVEEQSLHKAIKTKFIEGGPGFMASILLTLILVYL